MYDRQKYRKPLQHAQTSTFFQDYLDILERYCPKQTIHYETSTAVLVAMSFAMS